MSIKRILITTVTCIVILFIGVASYLYWAQRIVVHQFDGTVEKKDTVTLTVKGKYYNSGHPELQNADQERTVTVKITSDTQFLKVLMHVPTEQWIADHGGSFSDKDVVRETIAGSLEEMPTQISIKTSRNIHNKMEFTASSIEYYQFIAPVQP